MDRIHRFLTSEDGPTATEYAVMLSLVILAAIVTITNLGTKVTSAFETVESAMQSSS